MSEKSKTGGSMQAGEPSQPSTERREPRVEGGSPERRDYMDEYLQLLLEMEAHTPEEAGYGHGV